MDLMAKGGIYTPFPRRTRTTCWRYAAHAPRESAEMIDLMIGVWLR